MVREQQVEGVCPLAIRSGLQSLTAAESHHHECCPSSPPGFRQSWRVV